MIKLSAIYSKKIGLPEFSSHSFSVSVDVELTDISKVDSECQRLYQLLQHSVDQEIQNVGFCPEAKEPTQKPQNGRTYQLNGNRRPNNPQTKPPGDVWNCTDGQKGFIQRIINENNMKMQDADDMAQQLYGIGVKELDKLQASQVIEELLIKAGKPPKQHRWQQRQTTNTQAA